MSKKIIFIISIFFLFINNAYANTTEGNKIADAGAYLAVCDGCTYTVYQPSSRVYNSETKKYIDAREKVTSSHSYIGGDYASCDVGASTIVRYSGVDTNFEPFYTPSQYNYMTASDKWEKVGTFKMGQSTTSLQPGDVMLTSWSVISTGAGHIWVYLGNKAVQKYWPGSNSDAVQASYSSSPNSAFYPSLFNTKKNPDTRQYEVWRYKGKSSFDDIVRWAELQKVSKNIDLSTVNVCNIISDDLSDILSEIFTYICVAGIVLVVIMTIFDLIKVITGNAEENLSKMFKNFVIRIIVIVLLLLLPYLVTLTINLVNDAGNNLGYNKENPLCGVAK